VRVNYLADPVAGAFGNFGRALRGVLAHSSATLSNILTGRVNTLGSSFANVFAALADVLAGGSATLSNILTSCSNAFGSPFANGFGALADFTCRAALMGFLIGRSLRRA
jgi:hypothetical protein